MIDAQKGMRFGLWIVNFLCLGLCVAYWIGIFLSRFTPVTSQKSIVLVLSLTVVCAALGKFTWERLDLEEGPGRDFALLSTLIFPASALNFIFSPENIPGLTLALPFFAMAWTRRFHGKATHAEDCAEGFLTLLCQAAALGLVLRPSGQWWICMAAGGAVCGAACWLTGKSKPLLPHVILSPVMVLWFFLSLSNQLVNSYPGWSRLFLMTGAVLYLGLIGAAYLLAIRKSADLVAFNRVCLLIFAASLIMDINPEAGMSTPFHLLDFHWWIHVAPGLDALYGIMRPFVDYIPFEGFIFETMLPRLWFAGLNQTMGGYFMIMAALSFASQALFALLLYMLLNRALGAEKFVAGLLACLLTLGNISLLQVMYPFPGAWTVAERSIMCFACALVFSRLSLGGGGIWFVVLTGGVHALAFFYEPFFGLACLTALAGCMALQFRDWKRNAALASGVAGLLAAFIIVFNIPMRAFFLHQPLAMVDSGNQIVKLSEGAHIFQALFRDRALSVFHYLSALGAMLVFLGLAPSRARRHRLFGLALYFFLATFFMMISGGQRFFGEPKHSFSTVHFAAMASALALPLWICMVRIGLDMMGSPFTDRKRLAALCLTAAIFVAFTDGLHRGLAPGPARAGVSGRRFEATAWDEQIHYQAPFSNSAPVILEYFFACKSRRYVASGPRPLAMHYAPYSAWKDSIQSMQPVQDIRAFLSHSRPDRE